MSKEFPNARFWIWHNDGWCKITLSHPSSWNRHPIRLSIHEGGPTDEGYSYCTTSFEHTGPFVHRESSCCGSDCDGRIDSDDVSIARLEDLKAIEAGYDPEKCCWTGLQTPEIIFRPEWKHLSASQRDYAAEAAGY